MPINYGTNLLQLEKAHQPSVKNRFKMSFVNVDKVIDALKYNTTDSSLKDFFDKFKNSWDYMPIEVEFTPPTFSLETKSKHRQNIDVKYATWATWSDWSLSVNNFTDFHTYKFFYEWMIALAGFSRNSSDRDFVGKENFVSRVSIFDLKPDAIVKQISSHFSTIESQWLLKGVFPKSLKPDSYDNSNEGDHHMAAIDFSADSAFLDVSDTYQIQ